MRHTDVVLKRCALAARYQQHALYDDNDDDDMNA